MATQFELTMEQLPAVVDAVGDKFGIANLSNDLERFLEPGPGRSFVSQAATFGYTFLGATADLLLVIVAAVYMAADPTFYRVGTAKLLPQNQHGRILDAMDATGTALGSGFGANSRR